ncbi:MAG: fibronectin type III domain-containing protein, partial [Polaribacter sp.]
QIEEAFKNGTKLNTDSILTGINKTLEGKAYEIYHDVTNHSDFIFDSNVTNGFKAPGLKKAIETGFYTQAYRGINGYDYLVFTNRTKESKDFDIKIDGHQLNKKIEVNYISADSIKVKNTEIKNVTFKKGKINIPSFSVSVAKWKSKLVTKPANPTIYKGEVNQEGIKLTWGPIENVKKYIINYNEVSSDVIKQIKVSAKETSIEINNLKKGVAYNFKMSAENKEGVSEFSNQMIITNSAPKRPEIFKISRRNNTATIFWKSVANAKGYKIKYLNKNTGKENLVETNNVFGYRLKGLDYNVPYVFSVVAYNGIGLGDFSNTKTVSLSKKVPFSPKNVSAIRQPDGSVSVKWIEQDSILPETTYTIYRGLELHKYAKIASGIKKPFFKDTSAKQDVIYFYTVKAETSVGESNFYPNTATLFNSSDEYSIKIKKIEKQKKGYLLKVKFKNILLDGEYSYGVKIENISYLTVEENKIEGRNLSKKTNTFEVFIPNSKLNKKSKYALKAFVNTNGKSLFSKLPHRNIKTD